MVQWYSEYYEVRLYGVYLCVRFVSISTEPVRGVCTIDSIDIDIDSNYFQLGINNKSQDINIDTSISRCIDTYIPPHAYPGGVSGRSAPPPAAGWEA